MRSGRIQPAEVEEHQGTTLDGDSIPLPCHRALVDVPVGHVAARMANDVVRKAVDEVDPPLIGEHHVGVVDDGISLEARPPEPEEPAVDGADPGPYESQVVDAGGQEVSFGGGPPVAGKGPEVVRGHDNVVFGGKVGELAHASEYLDVRVEIEHRLTRSLQEMREQPGLDGRRELQDGVMGGHLPSQLLPEPHITEREYRKRLIAGLDRFVVDHQYPQRDVGVVTVEGLRQHPGPGQIIAGHNAAAGEIPHRWIVQDVPAAVDPKDDHRPRSASSIRSMSPRPGKASGP